MTNRTVKVWSLGQPTPNYTLEGHEKGVNCVDYYQGGEKRGRVFFFLFEMFFLCPFFLPLSLSLLSLSLQQPHSPPSFLSLLPLPSPTHQPLLQSNQQATAPTSSPGPTTAPRRSGTTRPRPASTPSRATPTTSLRSPSTRSFP